MNQSDEHSHIISYYLPTWMWVDIQLKPHLFWKLAEIYFYSPKATQVFCKVKEGSIFNRFLSSKQKAEISHIR